MEQSGFPVTMSLSFPPPPVCFHGSVEEWPATGTPTSPILGFTKAHYPGSYISVFGGGRGVCWRAPSLSLGILLRSSLHQVPGSAHLQGSLWRVLTNLAPSFQVGNPLCSLCGIAMIPGLHTRCALYEGRGAPTILAPSFWVYTPAVPIIRSSHHHCTSFCMPAVPNTNLTTFRMKPSTEYTANGGLPCMWKGHIDQSLDNWQTSTIFPVQPIFCPILLALTLISGMSSLRHRIMTLDSSSW